MAVAVPALTKAARCRPEPAVVRRALRSYVLPTPRRERERPAEVATAVRWLERASLPVAELTDIDRVYVLVEALGRKFDGKPAGQAGEGPVRDFYSAHPRMSEDIDERGIDLYIPAWHILGLTRKGRGDWNAALNYQDGGQRRAQ